MDNVSLPAFTAEFIMFYNVENLFTADIKPVRRHMLTASGLRNWNEWRYSNKISKIASVFNLAKEQNGKLPFLIGFSEVQGRAPLEALLQTPPFSSDYDIVHYESMDERGVDVALLYDKTKLELVSSEPISFIFEIDDPNPENYDTTRDILYCRMRYKAVFINVFVFHLPSKRDKDVNKPKRDYIMREMQKKIRQIMTESNEAVVLCGDFNENPDDENLTALLSGDNGTSLLSNPFQRLFADGNFSTFHFADGLLFDQIIFSQHFLKPEFPLNFREAEVFMPEQIQNWDKRFAGRPFRTFAGSRYLGGYSDHFPVIVKFDS